MSTRWNYQVVEVKPSFIGGLKSSEVQEELNRQGAKGWEFVQAVSIAPMAPLQLIFKRPG
jgi:hypothetical protein